MNLLSPHPLVLEEATRYFQTPRFISHIALTSTTPTRAARPSSTVFKIVIVIVPVVVVVVVVIVIVIISIIIISCAIVGCTV